MLNHTALAAGAPRAAQYDLIHANLLRARLAELSARYKAAKAAGEHEAAAELRARGEAVRAILVRVVAEL